MHDRLARLREQAATDLPPAWRPSKPGETLAGELVRWERGSTDYGPQDIAIVRDEEGTTHALWLLHSVLREEVAKQSPTVGDLIAVCYLGRKTSAAGQPYAHFRVVCEPEPELPDTPPDLGPDPEEPPF